MTRWKRLAKITLSAGLLALAGCARPGGTARLVFPRAPVVLISVDTLRSDHLPLYGYKGVETPALSSLRADSILCERAYAPAPLTLPSHLSILTGALPAEHGVHDNLGYHLAAKTPTLAELLKAKGYRTGAAVSAIVLNGTSGVNRGFDFYEDSIEPTDYHEALGRVQRPGDESAALLAHWIEAPGEGPIFAFLHIYEPHAPYEPKEPFRSRYTSAYDGEIATADAIVGGFLSHLKSRGLYDGALIVFLSDHGEGLAEHGEDEHGVFLYREDLQVPLLVKLPGTGASSAPLAGSTVSAPVVLTDVFATIGAAVGLEGLPAREGAVSILELAAGRAAPKRTLLAETQFPRIHFGWSELSSLLDGRFHYIEAPRPEFFDLAKDPGERENLATSKPDALRAMRTELLKRRAPFEAPGEVSEEDTKKLASLGYLSTGATAGSGPLADPKDEIGTIRLLNDAMAKVATGHPDASLPVFEKLLHDNPRMFDVWELYSQALFDAGRPDEALTARKKTVELAPREATLPLLSVANLCLQIGKLEEARKHAELAQQRGDPTASEVIARVCLAEGKLNEAEAAARSVVGVGKVRRRALLTLARVASHRGDYAKALDLARQASLSPDGKPDAPLVGVHRLRGDVLARMDRPLEAEKEFQEEIRLFPKSVDVRIELAVVYASLQRPEDVRRTLEALVTEISSPDAYSKAVKTLTVIGDRAGAEAMRRRGLSRFPRDTRLKSAS